LESLALLATPKLDEGGSEVEWVDDISGYGWVAHASRAWHSASPESPIVDLTLPASISSRLSFVYVAVSETLEQLHYEQQRLSAPFRKRTQRAVDVPGVPYAASSRSNKS
jgi:hypothetical protein